MLFFNRKKEAQEEETLRPPLRKPFARQSQSRDLRDLNPQNKRSRKEPPKPWGKKERLLILLLFGGTSLMSGILALSARAWRLPGLPRFTFPALEQTYILQKEEVDPRTQKDFSEAISNFESQTTHLSGVYGFSVVRLLTGSAYGLYAKEAFTAASLIKLPVMVALFKEAEAGAIDLDANYTLIQQDKTPGSGSLFAKPNGTKVTFRELVALMGQQSDNTAFRAVRRTLGDSKINTVIKELGMLDTSLEDNLTTPTDIALIFERLWRANYLTEADSQELLGYLTNTNFEDRIPAGVPDSVRVAHKIGSEVAVVVDGGIVFADEPFVLVIMTKGVIEKEAKEIFPSLAREIYAFETAH